LLDKGYVHMLAGASGSGKTTLTLQSVRKLQDDKPNLLGLQGAGVAWISADREVEQTTEKAKSIGIEMVEWYPGLVADDTLSEGKIHAYLKKNPRGLLTHIMDRFKKPYDLLVIDPLIPFMEGDMNSYQDVSISLILLNRIARKNKIAILGLTHMPKGQHGPNKYNKPQDQILGSNAFQGYCDTLHVLQDKPNSPIKNLYTRSHTAPEHNEPLIQKGPWLSNDPLDFPAGEGEESCSNYKGELSTADLIAWIMLKGSCSKRTAYTRLQKINELLQGKKEED